MKKQILFLFASILCCCIVNAQTNYLDNYIGNSITLTTIGNSANQVSQPRDLDFKPNSNELWVSNYGTSNGGTNVIFYNAGLPNQTSQYRKDSHSGHFMIYPSAIAFGDDGKWGCVSEIQNTNAASPTFMGPALWLSDTNVFAKVFQNNWVSGYPLGSHIDMLHQSPFAMGIAHDSLMAYWVMDGYNSNICKYDFSADHGPGYDNHSAGKIWRYTDIPVTRVVGVPSHMVLDKVNHWLYFIDGGPKQIKRMNTLSGSVTGTLTVPSTAQEPLAGYWAVTGATVEVLATLTTQPCGIDYYNGRLVVSDYTTGDIYLYSTNPFTLLTTINTGHAGMMGVKVGPDGHIWCVNRTENIVYRLDVIPPATDISIRSIDAPTVENYSKGPVYTFYSTAFDVCSNNITPAITVANNGTNVVNSIDLQYTIDGGAPVAYTWNGTLASNGTVSIALPSSSAVSGVHQLDVKIITVNGSADNVDLNNTMTGSFRTVDPPASLPFSEGFTTAIFPPANWNYIHFNTNNKMSRATVGGFATGVGSMKMDNYSGSMNITGQIDYLMSPVIDFTSGTANTWLKFSVAHAQYQTSTDALQVRVSTNCGSTWTTVYNKSGATLATTSSSTSAWTPTSASQWRTDSVSMASYAGQSDVIVMFTSISNYGNNLYVDDIFIGDLPTGISESLTAVPFNVYPNPVDEMLNINFNSTVNESVITRLTDIAGKTIYVQQFNLQAGNNNLSIPVKELKIEPGVYFLTLTQKENAATAKVIIQ